MLNTAKQFDKKYRKIIDRCEFFAVDDDCEVKYIGNQYREAALLCGERSRKLRFDKKICEKDNISSAAKNYYKLLYKNGRLIKVESFINGKADHIYLCYYEKNLRVLKPFTTDGGFYPAYTLITAYNKNVVESEVMIADAQIVYEVYRYGKYIEYEYANVVPNDKYKVMAYAKGRFDDGKYEEEETFVWYRQRG